MEPIETAKAQCILKGAEILKTSYVTKYHAHGGNDKRILIIADAFAAAYQIKRKGILFKFAFSWQNLSGFTTNGDVTTLTFDSGYSFAFSSPYDVREVIIDLISETLSKSRLIALGIPIKSEYASPRAAIARMKQFKFIQTAGESCSVGEEYRKQVLEASETVSVGIIQEDVLSELEGIRYAGFVAKAVVKSASNHVTEFFLNHDFHFKKLVLCDANLDLLLLVGNSKITDLIFSDAQVSTSKLSFNTIYSVLSHSNISSYGFVRHFSLFELSDVGKYTNIRYFSLERIKNISVTSLLAYLPQIEMISLSDCGLEVLDALNLIVLSNPRNLRAVDLSKNRVSKIVQFDLPSTLTTLDISGQTVFPTFLSGFLSFFVNQKALRNLSLNLSSIGAIDPQEWKDAFPDTEKDLGITEFHWDWNPIDPAFMKFLSCQRGLSMFHRKSYFQDYSSDLFSSLANVTHLCLSVPFQMNLLKKLHSIQYLDFSFSNLGDHFCLELVNFFVSSQKIRSLHFNGIGITSSEALKEVHQLIYSKNRARDVDVPTFDLYALYKEGKISKTCINAFTFDLPFDSFETDRPTPLSEGSRIIKNKNLWSFPLDFNTSSEEPLQEHISDPGTPNERSTASFTLSAVSYSSKASTGSQNARASVEPEASTEATVATQCHSYPEQSWNSNSIHLNGVVVEIKPPEAYIPRQSEIFSDYHQPDWSFPLPPSKQPSNSDVTRRLSSKYSIKAVFDRLT